MSEVDTAHGLTLIFDGQTEPSQKKYKMLVNGSTPSVGDRVAAIKHSGTYIVLGAIGTEGGGGGGEGDIAAPNTVYAGPANGTEPGEATFRTLTAADLPGMDYDVVSPDLHESSPPQGGAYGVGVRFLDADGNEMGIIRPYLWADGSQTLDLVAEVDDGAGGRTINFLSITKKKSGDSEYGIGNAVSFRKALGLGTSTGAFPIPVYQGGSGNTSSGYLSGTTVLEASSGVTVTSAYMSYWGKVAYLYAILRITSAVASGTTDLAKFKQYAKLPSYTPVYSAVQPPNATLFLGSSNYIRATGALAANEELIFSAAFILQ